VAERGTAGEVLQRDAPGALVEQGGEPGGGVVVDVVEGEQRRPGPAEDVGEQQLGVDARRLDACLG
jgi:hypothetical protein